MKWLKNRFGLLTIPFLLAGCISIPTGDGEKIKLSKDGLEFEDKEGEKSTISVNSDEGGYSLETDGITSNVGANATIPNDFPKEILLPKDGQLLISNETDYEGRPAYVLSYKVQGDMTKDAEDYHDYLTDNGYEINEISLGEAILAYQGRKTTHYLHYQLMGDAGDPDYMMNVSYGELE